MTCSVVHGQNSLARSGEISKQTSPNVQAPPSLSSARLMGWAVLEESGREEMLAARETVPFPPASPCLSLFCSQLAAVSVDFWNHKSDHALLYLKALQQLPHHTRKKTSAYGHTASHGESLVSPSSSSPPLPPLTLDVPATMPCSSPPQTLPPQRVCTCTVLYPQGPSPLSLCMSGPSDP